MVIFLNVVEQISKGRRRTRVLTARWRLTLCTIKVENLETRRPDSEREDWWWFSKPFSTVNERHLKRILFVRWPPFFTAWFSRMSKKHRAIKVLLDSTSTYRSYLVPFRHARGILCVAVAPSLDVFVSKLWRAANARFDSPHVLSITVITVLQPWLWRRKQRGI